MKKYILVIFTISIILSQYSCKTKKSIIASESQYYTDSIYSKHLSEYRKHNIYLPKGFDKSKEYSIIYATDGNEKIENSAEKKILDSLINNKLISPVIYIASYSNNKNAQETEDYYTKKTIYSSYRSFEYVEGSTVDPPNADLEARFKNHMLYFKDEFIPAIEKTLKIKAMKSNRIFYGYSNGAGFGINFLNKNPGIINTFICFSTLGSNYKNLTWKKNIKYPNLYIEYGNKEANFFVREAESVIKNYETTNSFYEFQIFEGGHEKEKWDIELAKTLVKILK